jgi:hypothetical protein
MTLEKLIDLGIAAKVTNEIFVYHVTGFLTNITYHGNSKSIIFSSVIDGTVYREEKSPHYLDFEDFIAYAKGIANHMHNNGHPIPYLDGSNLN